ncbi:LSU ribosomal protein L20p [Candidatus Phytoplasma solani]|uniref:50S ribosomal protein L20 n=1 Tax=Candidatus Phytoplasma solani TaxID=69896 RepID=UPI0032DAE71A
MAKINFTPARHKRRKKVLKLAKGYFGSKSTLYKTAHEQVMRSLQYSYRDRKQRKRDFRKLWIARVNAGCMSLGIKYSHLMHGLVLAKVDVNRKVLADLAYQQPEVFSNYVKLAQSSLKQFKKELTKQKTEEEKQQEVKLQKELQQQKNEAEKEELELTRQQQEELEKNKKELQQQKNEAEKKAKLPKNNSKFVIDKLSKMLLPELKQLAKDYQISGIYKLKKIEIITLLKEVLMK